MKTETSEEILNKISPREDVAILLAHYNGEKFIRDQISSLKAQTYKPISIYISDDCSTGESFRQLKWLVENQEPDVTLTRNKSNLGYAENFLFMSTKVKKASYYAFCDQDDIWSFDKIERAVRVLRETPAEIPALYCSRTEITDESGRIVRGLSPLFRYKPSFGNALIQNIGGGNTMVFNNAACKLICSTSENNPVVAHDWWAYIIVSGVGGQIFYDPKPTLKYRQHENNAIGSNGNWRARIIRLRKLFSGEYKQWNDKNINALVNNSQLLTPENQKLLTAFRRARDESFLNRICFFYECGIYRQTLFGNLALWLGILLKKI